MILPSSFHHLHPNLHPPCPAIIQLTLCGFLLCTSHCPMLYICLLSLPHLTPFTATYSAPTTVPGLQKTIIVTDAMTAIASAEESCPSQVGPHPWTDGGPASRPDLGQLCRSGLAPERPLGLTAAVWFPFAHSRVCSLLSTGVGARTLLTIVLNKLSLSAHFPGSQSTAVHISGMKMGRERGKRKEL